MAAVLEAERISPTPFQSAVLAVPEEYDLALPGGRGGGKSYALLLQVLRHAEKHGDKARALLVRKDFPSLQEIESEAQALFGQVYGRRLRFNQQQHRFTFPNGARFTVDQLEAEGWWSKFQGRNRSLVICDEAGEYASPHLLDKLRSILRSKAGVPCRYILASNPGGIGHHWVNQRHVAGVVPWEPYRERQSGRMFVTCPSTLRDNPHLPAGYSDQLKAATATDEALQRAWIDGDWAVAKGAFFGSVLDYTRNAIEPWSGLPGSSMGEGMSPIERKLLESNMRNAGVDRDFGWTFYVSGDHGSSAPCIFYLIAKSPGARGPDGVFYPRGSLIAFDEVGYYDPENLDRGLGMTVPAMAQGVIEACEGWGMRPRGALDDATFSYHGSSEGTLGDEYRSAGLQVYPANKGDRMGGWQALRRMMADAGKPDRPGFYVSTKCEFFWRTVPYLGRDPKRQEDLDTKAIDHGADAVRMAVTYEQPRLTRKKLTGW